MAKKTKGIKPSPSSQWHVKCGDALERMRKLPYGTVDLCIHDPPYNIGYPGYASYNDNKPAAAYFGWYRDMLAGIKRSLSPTGQLWIFAPDESVSEIDIMCRNEFGLFKRNHCIWGMGFGVHCEKKFSRGHVHILNFTVHKTKFTFNADAVRVPSDRQAIYGDKRAVAGGKTPSNVWVLTRAEMDKVLPLNGDVWYESRICGTFGERKNHCPNQIPLLILQRIISATSNPGDLVMDPCAGTFSTGAAAIGLGRRFVGFDIDPVSAQEGEKRLQTAQAAKDKPDDQLKLFRE